MTGSPILVVNNRSLTVLAVFVDVFQHLQGFLFNKKKHTSQDSTLIKMAPPIITSQSLDVQNDRPPDESNPLWWGCPEKGDRDPCSNQGLKIR